MASRVIRSAGATRWVFPLLLAALAAVWPKPAQARRGDKTIPLDVRIVDEAPPEPEEELADIQRRIDQGELPKIQFDFDSDHLKEESHETLEMVADLLRRNPRYKLLIVAHTCAIGTKKYNLDLSERRAKSVMTYLVKRGLPPPALRFRGKGFSEPIADNSTEEGREKNRRVEFRILKRWWSSIY